MRRSETVGVDPDCRGWSVCVRVVFRTMWCVGPVRALILVFLQATVLSVEGKGACPVGVTSLRLTINTTASTAILSNGYVCACVAPGQLVGLYADFEGRGQYGRNVLSGHGMTLRREDSQGHTYTSATLGPGQVDLVALRNDSAVATVEMANIVDSSAHPAVRETWTFTLLPADRAVTFRSSGGVVRAGVTARSISRYYELRPTALYAWFKGGVVQMKNAGAGSDFYISNDALYRFYSLGGSGAEEQAVGNASFDWTWTDTTEARPAQTALLSSSSGRPYWSGLQEVLAGGVASAPSDLIDHWRDGWESVPDTAINSSLSWNYTTELAANNMDFPASTVGTNIQVPTKDVHAIMTGTYASPVGNLCTHMNEVRDGVSVGQIATSIALPGRGYSGTYNYFDPDNYLATSALVWSNEPYLQEQVRAVLERSGSFLKTNGQLPHHFVGTKPVYQALSGEIQTGPNVFWILSCFNYAKASQNFSWLREYMPTLRLASEFLFDLIDPRVQLANVPGSLMIDVFLRSNFTTDTNAQLVGFFKAFADAEEFCGNATGAFALRDLASNLSAAMNKYLWATTEQGDDHFVTQWNGPDDNTVRDFVDYDANLIAVAHGIVGPSRAARVFQRIDDGGQCRASATFVSERYYGPNDTTGAPHGNIGDSWCAMGRIAWFDALGRKRFGDVDGFERYVLHPLQDLLVQNTWMHERLHCDGSQELNRTAAYFEYPSVVAMLLREVRYGITLGFSTVTIAPFGINEFQYHIGNVHVDFSPTRVSMVLPGAEGVESVYTVSPVAKLASFNLILRGDACHRTSDDIKSIVISDKSGQLSFKAPQGLECNVTVSKV